MDVFRSRFRRVFLIIYCSVVFKIVFRIFLFSCFVLRGFLGIFKGFFRFVFWFISFWSLRGEFSFFDIYYDEQDKIDEVVEGVSIYYVVYDFYLVFQSDYLQLGQSREERQFEIGRFQERQVVEIVFQIEVLLCVGTFYIYVFLYFL